MYQSTTTNPVLTTPEVVEISPMLHFDWVSFTSFSLTLVLLLSLLLKIEPISSSAWLGVLFLSATLIPNNLIKIGLPVITNSTRVIVKLRRELGITSGILFLIHASLGLISHYLGESSPLLTPQVVLGFISAAIFILLLLTANTATQRKLKGSWKKIHSIVWITIPLSLTHAVMATSSGISAFSYMPLLFLMLIASQVSIVMCYKHGFKFSSFYPLFYVILGSLPLFYFLLFLK